MEFISLSRTYFNTIHANDFEFYKELNQVIQREPVEMLSPEICGLFASIGIIKGRPFAPDARMKGILTEAVAVGNATARSIVFDARIEETFLYPNSVWITGFVGGSYEWLIDGGMGGRYLDSVYTVLLLCHSKYAGDGAKNGGCGIAIRIGFQR